MTNTKIEKEYEEDIVKRLWQKFKSCLGNSSIDNKNNSMYDLETFLRQALLTAYQQGKKDRDEEVMKKLDEILCKYSNDRPIPPSVIRAFQDTFINQNNEK